MQNGKKQKQRNKKPLRYAFTSDAALSLFFKACENFIFKAGNLHLRYAQYGGDFALRFIPEIS